MYKLVISGIDKDNKEITRATVSGIFYDDMVNNYLPFSKEMIVGAMVDQKRPEDARNIVRTLVSIEKQGPPKSVNI